MLFLYPQTEAGSSNYYNGQQCGSAGRLTPINRATVLAESVATKLQLRRDGTRENRALSPSRASGQTILRHSAERPAKRTTGSAGQFQPVYPVLPNAHHSEPEPARRVRSVDRMSCETCKCSVCGGTMRRIKVLPGKLGHFIRFRCTCGHCEDLSEEKLPPPAAAPETFILEGFQEIP
jgi:hypothetical protein